ncbi:UNVERIFIED_CONTAM: Alpha-(1,4)-fucosyltransferase [Sesamum latifolium]|uniref:Fucosyltransferase n=1 Tax=Sesamum latifolium TaxID=2727402 RepID=A0AAW2W8B5_9LAMI
MQLKSINTFVITLMLGFALIIFFFTTSFLEFPSANSSVSSILESSIFETLSNSSKPEPFTDLLKAFKKWDSQVGCAQFREKHKELLGNRSKISSLQDAEGQIQCGELQMKHVSVLVKGWTWIPDNMDNLYSCRCGLSCLWTKSSVLADKPDAQLFETTAPPFQRLSGDPLRVYMDLEAGRKKSGYEDIFISYHAKDDVQSTYAGALFHNNRNYHLSSFKNNDTLVYWSSSRCLPQRNQLAKKLLSLLPHHSFGKCMNNVGGLGQALSFYPECVKDSNEAPKWWDHLHCAMSRYKFVLAIENTITESYVTEKLFYALDSGAVPIYFGAPNVWDFVPPHSIIDGTQFSSMAQVASYIKSLANDPVAYAEYHAWRRCGVLGNYRKTRAASLDTLPCRLCEAVSRKNGRNAKAL